jgi:hypothetical protein
MTSSDVTELIDSRLLIHAVGRQSSLISGDSTNIPCGS